MSDDTVYVEYTTVLDTWNKPSWYLKDQDIIIKNNNIRADGRMKKYAALSYVSNGIFKDCSLWLEDNNGTRSEVKLRASDDILALTTGLAIAREEGYSLWIDEVSLVSDNYENKMNNLSDSTSDSGSLKMRAVGEAYSLASTTYVPLVESDFIWLKKAYSFMDALGEVQTVEQLEIKLGNKAEDILGYALKLGSGLGPYSYWSRAWTAQELHLSKEVVYCRKSVIGGSHMIASQDNIRTNRIAQQVAYLKTRTPESRDRVLMKIMSLVSDTMKSVIPGKTMLLLESKYYQAMNNMINITPNVDLSKRVSMDYIFISTMSTRPRSARNAEEMVEASAIALGIYVKDAQKAWNAITKKATELGFSKSFDESMVDEGQGWSTSKVELTHGEKSNRANTDQVYISTMFSQLTWDMISMSYTFVVNNGGGLATDGAIMIFGIKRVDSNVNVPSIGTRLYDGGVEFGRPGYYKTSELKIKLLEYNNGKYITRPTELRNSNMADKMRGGLATRMAKVDNDGFINAIAVIKSSLELRDGEVITVLYMGRNSYILDDENKVVGSMIIDFTTHEGRGYLLDAEAISSKTGDYTVLPGKWVTPWWESESRIMREQNTIRSIIKQPKPEWVDA